MQKKVFFFDYRVLDLGEPQPLSPLLVEGRVSTL